MNENYCSKEEKAPVCKTTECEEVKGLKNDIKAWTVTYADLQSELDDERDKSQKLEQELKTKKDYAAYWMNQAISTRELLGESKAYTKQIVTQRDKLQQDNEKLREANRTWLNLHDPAPLREENRKLRDRIKFLESFVEAKSTESLKLEVGKDAEISKYKKKLDSIQAVIDGSAVLYL